MCRGPRLRAPAVAGAVWSARSRRSPTRGHRLRPRASSAASPATGRVCGWRSEGRLSRVRLSCIARASFPVPSGSRRVTAASRSSPCTVLYPESDLDLEEHYTDTRGFTQINFAAFGMVHHQHVFAPGSEPPGVRSPRDAHGQPARVAVLNELEEFAQRALALLKFGRFQPDGPRNVGELLVELGRDSATVRGCTERSTARNNLRVGWEVPAARRPAAASKLPERLHCHSASTSVSSRRRIHVGLVGAGRRLWVPEWPIIRRVAGAQPPRPAGAQSRADGGDVGGLGTERHAVAPVPVDDRRAGGDCRVPHGSR